MARFSWKRGKAYCGRMRMPNTYELRFGGAHLATAQESSEQNWFWYGDGINTAHRMDTLENVKSEALAHFKNKQQSIKSRMNTVTDKD